MLISVNVVKTYPVSWNRYKIFRDFIQNFYDSVGFKNFAKSFQYKFNKNKSVLEIFVNNVTFSYEWLLHIGASTKTQNSNDNAGYFGEGFKIASLCAIRDYFYTVTMESGKWKLKVLFVESIIDHQKIEMLSYDLVKLKKEKNISKLTLGNIKEDDYDTFLYTIQSFYFPENPIFGEKIWEDKTGGLYYRSKNEIDERLPYTDKFSRKGAVFCNFQMLGTHPFPFVICNNKARIKDRERKSLYRFDVIDIFEEMANSIPSSAAMTVLEFMRKYWYCVNHKRTDIYSWKPVIDILVYNISKSKEITEAFKAKYPNIVCLNTVHFYDEINRRRAAKEWYKNR